MNSRMREVKSAFRNAVVITRVEHHRLSGCPEVRPLFAALQQYLIISRFAVKIIPCKTVSKSYLLVSGIVFLNPPEDETLLVLVLISRDDP